MAGLWSSRTPVLVVPFVDQTYLRATPPVRLSETTFKGNCLVQAWFSVTKDHDIERASLARSIIFGPILLLQELRAERLGTQTLPFVYTAVLPYAEHVRRISCHMIYAIFEYRVIFVFFEVIVIANNSRISVTYKGCNFSTFLVISTLVMVCIVFFVPLLFCYCFRGS